MNSFCLNHPFSLPSGKDSTGCGNQKRNGKRKNSRTVKRTKTPEKGKHRCESCQKEFSTKGNLVQHMDTHVDLDDTTLQSTFDCDVCGKKFLQKRYLVAHKTRCSSRTVQAKKAHSCTLCGKIFPRVGQLRRHQSHHVRQNSYKCEICDQGFVQVYHLQRHYRSIRHLQKEAQSQLSRASLETSSSHVQSIMQKRFISTSSQYFTHKCYFCTKTFATLWEMQRHWRTVHPYAVRRNASSATSNQSQSAKVTFLLKCTRCRASFDNELMYRNHLEWHQGKRTYKCDICKFSFNRRIELETHKAAKHGVGWMFECAQCDQRFAQRTSLDRHLKTCAFLKISPIVASESTMENLSTTSLSSVPKEGPSLRCKFCGMENVGVDNHRIHVSRNHFRKVFVEETVPSNQLNYCQSIISPNIDTISLTPSDMGSQESIKIQLVVNIGLDSKPVRVLHLASSLPTWLLQLQPSFEVLDVALDDSEPPLAAGERIVLDLPLSGSSPVASIKNKIVNVCYSV